MIKIYLSFFCLLSAQSIVQMETLNVEGRVGESVTFVCSDWNVWGNVKQNAKYFCHSPCSEDKHIISKAAFGATKHDNRIKLVNRGKGLSVTLTNLQKSDSKRYLCGVDRIGPDSFIKVNLTVRAAESSTSTPEPVVAGSTFSFVVTSTMSSIGSDIITDNSTSYTTIATPTPASAAQGAGSIPYLIVGVIIITTILMVLLKFMHKMMVTKPMPSDDPPQEDTQENVEYDEIRPEDQPDPDCLYANYNYQQGTKLAADSGNSHSKDVSLNPASRSEVIARGSCADSRVTGPQCDLVYSVAQLPKELPEPNQSESNGNDSVYSLAQLPQAT